MRRQGSCSHGIKFKDFSRTTNINFQVLNVDISSYHYTLLDISLTVKLCAILELVIGLIMCNDMNLARNQVETTLLPTY